MPQYHPALTEFVLACQQRYTCYVLAAHHLDEGRTRFENARPENRFFIGEGHPDDGMFTASMSMLELREKMRRDGEFADALAKALLVAIYSDWDEHFRPALANAVGVKKNRVKCDLMGDLRRIRNCIVHERSQLSPADLNLVCLAWKLVEGPLTISAKMFSQFMTLVNNLEVRVE